MDVKGLIEELPFHKPMRQRAVCAQRSANGKVNALPLVRARGRALRHCLLAEQLQTICSAIGEEPSGLGCHRALPLGCHQRGRCRGYNNGDPGTAGSGESAASPKAPRHWIVNGFATRGKAMACALGRSAGHAANVPVSKSQCLMSHPVSMSRCLNVSASLR